MADERAIPSLAPTDELLHTRRRFADLRDCLPDEPAVLDGIPVKAFDLLTYEILAPVF